MTWHQKDPWCILIWINSMWHLHQAQIMNSHLKSRHVTCSHDSTMGEIWNRLHKHWHALVIICGHISLRETSLTLLQIMVKSDSLYIYTSTIGRTLTPMLVRQTPVQTGSVNEQSVLLTLRHVYRMCGLSKFMLFEWHICALLSSLCSAS